ncbi:MAG: HNH endonuclease signature motif containing protein [Sphingomicrobium sp.]
MPRFGDKRLPSRFWEKVKRERRCWLWQAGKGNHGYGIFHVRKDGRERQWKAHRLAYETLVGRVPKGLELDHTCKNPACVNPKCLEPVTHKENCLRGNGWSGRHARKTHCPYGHEYTSENTYVYRNMRFCRACWPRKNAEQRQRQKEKSDSHI